MNVAEGVPHHQQHFFILHDVALMKPADSSSVELTVPSTAIKPTVLVESQASDAIADDGGSSSDAIAPLPPGTDDVDEGDVVLRPGDLDEPGAWLAYTVFLIVGIGVLFPYQTFLLSFDFFQVAQRAIATTVQRCEASKADNVITWRRTCIPTSTWASCSRCATCTRTVFR